jgi:purine-nucleoside phosphorylase
MYAEAAAAIRKRTALEPKIAIVLGSGLGGFADAIGDSVAIAYEDIPGWPTSTAIGHAGKLVVGTFRGVPIAAMKGRAHLYEGHAPQKVVFGVRALAALGVETFLFTNAAGALNPAFAVGDLILLNDHINMSGANPLSGANDDALGPRFPDMGNAYDSDLRAIAHDAARAVGQTLKEGVYLAFSGPTYETHAEVRMARLLGGDLVGMSTVHEVIAARHMSKTCLAISCVTNMGAGMTSAALDGDHVIAAGAAASERFTALVGEIIPRLPR